MGWGSGSVSTIVGFGLSIFFIAFVFTRLLCRRLQATAPRPTTELDFDPRIDIEQPQQRLTGLEPVIVAEIPTARFNREAFSTEDSQCSICLGDYEEGEVLRVLTKCGHKFHRVCVDIWLRKQSTCPVCRLSLKDLIKREGREAAAIDLSRPQQWRPPWTENSQGSGRDRGDHPDI